MHNNTCKFLLILLIVIFAIPSIVWSQDTLNVKLGPTTTTDNSLNSLRASRVIINYLIPSTDYIINTSHNEDSFADLLGLREIDSAIIPENFIASAPVLQSDIVLLGHSGKKARTLDDIVNDDVGVISKSYAQHRFREHSQFAYEFSSISQLYAAFINRNVDFIIVESSIAKSILENAPQDFNIKVYNKRLFTSDVGFLINPERDSLVEYINTKITSFKASANYNSFVDEYYSIPTDTFWAKYRMIIISMVALSIGLYLLIKNKEILNSLLKSYSIQLNGIIQIRPLPSIKFLDDEAFIKDSFKEKYSAFQINNTGIQTDIEFNGQAVKLTLNSESDLKISNSEYLDILAQDLEGLIKSFPVEMFIIDLNVSGQYQNLSTKKKFSFTNKGNSVDYITIN